jgi:hypothetical protein
MDRPVAGNAADVQEIGRPVRCIEQGERGRPEGRLRALSDQWRAEEELVMAPVLEEADRRAAIIALDRDRNHPDQGMAVADLDDADMGAAAQCRQSGGDEPIFGEAVGLGGGVGKLGPFPRQRLRDAAGFMGDGVIFVCAGRGRTAD